MLTGLGTVKFSVFIRRDPARAVPRGLLLAMLVSLPLLSLAGAEIKTEALDVSQGKSATPASKLASKSNVEADKVNIEVGEMVAPKAKLPISLRPESVTKIPGVEEQPAAADSASVLDLSLPEKLYSEGVPIDDNGDSVLDNPSKLSNLFDPKKKKESNLSITGKPLFKTVDGPITRDNLIDQVDGASLNVEIKN